MAGQPAKLVVRGISRLVPLNHDDARQLLVTFNRAPTDPEMAQVHDHLARRAPVAWLLEFRDGSVKLVQSDFPGAIPVYR